MCSTFCLQVFEDGQLTDGLGNTVDFKNVILIMTSNIGAQVPVKRRSRLGFHSEREDLVSEKVEKNGQWRGKKDLQP